MTEGLSKGMLVGMSAIYKGFRSSYVDNLIYLFHLIYAADAVWSAIVPYPLKYFDLCVVLHSLTI